ncbi:MAG TPA: four helix bundle protein [Flavisolibacter sp.]|nr:four helix bundle protein [Flavisolibacter sp.]
MDPLKLEDLEIYQLAQEIGEHVWTIVDTWDYFQKRTVGAQFVEAADSISANIAEGYGRYFYKDRKIFCYYSRGSIMETKNWAFKSLKRLLISQADYDELLGKLQVLHQKLNIYIKKLKSNTSN